MYSNKLAYLELITVPPKSQSYSNLLQNPWKILANEFLFRVCNFDKKEWMFNVFEDFFHKTPRSTSAVIVNRLWKVFDYVNNMINH